jgi:hypothetical protein
MIRGFRDETFLTYSQTLNGQVRLNNSRGRKTGFRKGSDRGRDTFLSLVLLLNLEQSSLISFLSLLVCYILTKEEGGRHTPFFTGYRPQFYFRTTDVTGDATLPEGVERVMPGDNVAMEIELIQPIAMDAGLRFAIREGGRTVGSGVVTEIIQ